MSLFKVMNTSLFILQLRTSHVWSLCLGHACNKVSSDNAVQAVQLRQSCLTMSAVNDHDRRTASRTAHKQKSDQTHQRLRCSWHHLGHFRAKSRFRRGYDNMFIASCDRMSVLPPRRKVLQYSESKGRNMSHVLRSFLQMWQRRRFVQFMSSKQWRGG